MNFSIFLKTRQVEYGYSTIKEHFEDLGGTKDLDITLRYFQQIYNGDRPPTEKILSAIFSKTKSNERKLLIIAYFRSTLGENKKKQNLLSYLESNLNPELGSISEGFWKHDIPKTIFSEKQIKLLIENRDLLKIHNRILLYEKIPLLDLNRNKIQDLIENKLVKVEGNFAVPYDKYMIIPSSKNSDTYLTSLGTQYMLKILDSFISKEGSDRQKNETFLFLVPSSIADKILIQINYFIEWARLLAKDPPKNKNEDLVPFFISVFGKKLEKRDL
jgi:hypothetical protein